MSIVLGLDFLKYLKGQPASKWVKKPFGEVFPDFFSKVEELFNLRHVYAHELAPSQKVSAKKIEDAIGAGAMLVTQVEELIKKDFLTT
jgi:hypothetical protein